jgi:hypothetical protein
MQQRFYCIKVWQHKQRSNNSPLRGLKFSVKNIFIFWSNYSKQVLDREMGEHLARLWLAKQQQEDEMRNQLRQAVTERERVRDQELQRERQLQREREEEDSRERERQRLRKYEMNLKRQREERLKMEKNEGGKQLQSTEEEYRKRDLEAAPEQEHEELKQVIEDQRNNEALEVEREKKKLDLKLNKPGQIESDRRNEATESAEEEQANAVVIVLGMDMSEIEGNEDAFADAVREHIKAALSLTEEGIERFISDGDVVLNHWFYDKSENDGLTIKQYKEQNDGVSPLCAMTFFYHKKVDY